MGKNTVRGITLEIGGNTSGLNKAFSETDKQMRKVSSELKDIDRLLKIDPGNTELLAQKQKLLGEQIESAGDKLGLLKKAQEAADKAIKEGAAVNQEQYRKLQREIVATEKSLESLKDESDGLGKLAKKVDDVADSAEDMEEGFTLGKGAIAGFIADTASSFVSAAGDMMDSSREFRNEMALLEAAGKSHGYSTEETAEAYKYLYSVIGDETSARTALNNAQALGLSQTDLMDILKSGVGAWGAYGDSIPIDGLMESINETAKVGRITGTLADALNWAGISEDTFNEKLKSCSNEQERQKLIAETLNGEYASFADNYVKNNQELVKFNENTLKQSKATAEIGEKLQPIEDKLTEIKTQCLDKIADAFAYIQENSVVFTVLLGLIGALTVGIGAYNAVQTVKNILDTAQTTSLWAAVAAQLGLNAAMWASPITWIVAGIVGLVATFVILWNKCEGFRNFWINLWDIIKNAFSSAWKFITEGIANIGKKISEGFSNMKNIGANLLTGIWEGITDKVEWLKSKVGGVVNKIKSWFTGKDGFDTHSPSKWSEGVFANVMDGAAKGSLKTNRLMTAIKASLGKVKSAFLTNMPGSTINVLSRASDVGQPNGNIVKSAHITNHYHGYKGTISENNAALKKTIRNMEVSLA